MITNVRFPVPSDYSSSIFVLDTSLALRVDKASSGTSAAVATERAPTVAGCCPAQAKEDSGQEKGGDRGPHEAKGVAADTGSLATRPEMVTTNDDPSAGKVSQTLGRAKVALT